MPIATQCSHCGKGYQVAESTLGKQVKCQACGKVFVVAAVRSGSNPAAQAGRAATRAAAPAQGKSPTSSSPGAGRSATATAAPPTSPEAAERAALAKLEARFGLQPLPPNPNRVFPAVEYRRPKGTPDPLANHVVTDPGFEQVSEADYAAYQEDLLRQEQQAKMDYLANLSNDDELVTKSGTDLYWLYIVAIVQVLAGLLAAPLAGIHAVIGGAALGLPLMVSLFAPTIDAFLVLNRNGRLNEVILLFIPVYNIIYYFSNFKIFKHHFFGSLAINFAIILSFIIFGVMLGMLGLDIKDLRDQARAARGY